MSQIPHALCVGILDKDTEEKKQCPSNMGIIHPTVEHHSEWGALIQGYPTPIAAAASPSQDLCQHKYK